MDKEIIQIKTDYITLAQFLKFTGIISNGSEAKNFIFDNEVLVNGETCTQRGKKLYDGYLVLINNSELFEIKHDN